MSRVMPFLLSPKGLMPRYLPSGITHLCGSLQSSGFSMSPPSLSIITCDCGSNPPFPIVQNRHILPFAMWNSGAQKVDSYLPSVYAKIVERFTFSSKSASGVCACLTSNFFCP